MNWFRIDHDFFDSKLAQALEKELGPAAGVHRFRLLTAIFMHMRTEEELLEILNEGRTFSEKRWADLVGISSKKFQNLIKILEKFEEISVKIDEKKLISVKLLNPKKVLDIRGLSSKARGTLSHNLGQNWATSGDPKLSPTNTNTNTNKDLSLNLSLPAGKKPDRSPEKKNSEGGKERLVDKTETLKAFENQFAKENHELLSKIIEHWNAHPKLVSRGKANKPVGRAQKDVFSVLANRAEWDFWRRALDNFAENEFFDETRGTGFPWIITSGKADQIASAPTPEKKVSTQRVVHACRKR